MDDYLYRALISGVAMVFVMEFAQYDGRIRYWTGYLLGRLTKKAHAALVKRRTPE